MLDIDHPKANPGHLYLRQQRTLEIIQLVEGPPPPRRIASSLASSSYSYYDSEPSSSSDEESESLCSSYCSSDVRLDSDTSQAQRSADRSDDTTFSIRMKRILAWRENFSSTMGTACSDTSSLKRKFNISDELPDGDDISHSSKRTCSHKTLQGGLSASALNAYPCPACDAFFPSRQRLRQHGLNADANEACCAAVEYALE